MRVTAASSRFWTALHNARDTYTAVAASVQRDGASPAIAGAPWILDEYGQWYWHTCGAGLWVLPADANGLAVADCDLDGVAVLNPSSVASPEDCRTVRCAVDDQFDVDKATHWVIAHRTWPFDGVDTGVALAVHALAMCAARQSTANPTWGQGDATWCEEVGPIPAESRCP